VLVCGVSQGITETPVAWPAFGGMDDEHTPVLAMEQLTLPGDVVVETCLGLGCTTRSAQKTGRVALAMELNPRRLACSIDELATKFGLQYEKVGEIAQR
jgi:hypothetical protein